MPRLWRTDDLTEYCRDHLLHREKAAQTAATESVSSNQTPRRFVAFLKCRGAARKPDRAQPSRSGSFNYRLIGDLNQPPRLRELRLLRDIFLIPQPPLLIQGGEKPPPLRDSAKIEGSWSGLPSSGPSGHLLPTV